MKILHTSLLFIALSLSSYAVESLPDAAQNLLKKRQEAVDRLDVRLNKELEKVKLRCMKDGDLDGANTVEALIKSPDKSLENDAKDPLVGSVWNFRGVNRQKINEFRFLKGGKVKCESSYKHATWRRLDKNNILFSYGTDASYIVFRVSDANNKIMSGHHYSGRSRSIQRIK